MIDVLVSLLVFILIASVVLWVVRTAIAAVGPPKPIYSLVYAIVVLILLGLFLSEIGWVGAHHGWRTWR